MRYLLAIFLPPLAILTTGKIFQAILNFILCIAVILLSVFSLGGLFWLWLVCIMHAAFAIDSYNRGKKTPLS
ncbi:MAG: YqaE/Pmp3 family membrane protein [Idiomarina sp.]